MGLRNKQRNHCVGQIIKAYREKNNMTQKELGEKIDKGESTIRMWELGKSEPDIETLILLSDIFDIEIKEFFVSNNHHDIETKDLSIVKRPEYSLAEKFASEYADLLKDNNYLEITKLCNAVSPELVALALGYIVGLFQKRGVNTQAILGY